MRVYEIVCNYKIEFFTLENAKDFGKAVRTICRKAYPVFKISRICFEESIGTKDERVYSVFITFDKREDLAPERIWITDITNRTVHF